MKATCVLLPIPASYPTSKQHSPDIKKPVCSIAGVSCGSARQSKVGDVVGLKGKEGGTYIVEDVSGEDEKPSTMSTLRKKTSTMVPGGACLMSQASLVRPKSESA